MTKLYQTPRGAELRDYIKLSSTNYPYAVYSLQVKAELDQLIQVNAQYEVTNDLGFNVMVGDFLCFGPRFNDYNYIAPAFPAAENVTPNMHHGTRRLIGHFITPVPDPMVYLGVYADASKGGGTIRVEQRYGGLSAIVYSFSGAAP